MMSRRPDKRRASRTVYEVRGTGRRDGAGATRIQIQVRAAKAPADLKPTKQKSRNRPRTDVILAL
jgi:hypothetical protein